MNAKNDLQKTSPRVSLANSIIVFVVLLVAILVITLIYSGPISIVMLLGAIFAAGVAILSGFSYKTLERAICDAVRDITTAILIMLVIGMVIGEWILGGIIPSMIYYGLKLLNTKIFFVVSMLICSIFSVSTGSSWSTVGTVGIALLGVGSGLGIPPALTAGAIVSGAYFGDKLSPLSDTTNLAASSSGTDVFTHMRFMLHTTLPSYLISLGVFFAVGLFYSSSSTNSETVSLYTSTLAKNFVITPVLLIPVFVIFIVIALKVPAIPGLLVTAAVGLCCVLFVQGVDIITALKAAYSGVSIESGVAEIDKLVNRGGMTSMLNTICLLITSSCFTGVASVSGMIDNLVHALMKFAKKDSQIILITQATALLANIETGSSNVAIILVGGMYKDFYRERNLHSKNLSRACEDMCTMTSALIPWSTSGAYISGALGVATFTYLPFCVFNLVSVVLSVIVAISGKDIARLAPTHEEEASV